MTGDGDAAHIAALLKEPQMPSPTANDTVHIRLAMRNDGGPFWQTNAVIASVSARTVMLDGFDRQVTASVTELKPMGPGRWSLDWEIKTRP